MTESLRPDQVAALKKSNEFVQSLINAGLAELIVEQYLAGKSLASLAQQYVPNNDMSSRVGVTVISSIVGMYLHPDERRIEAEKHVLSAYEGDTIGEKKHDFGRVSAERRGHELVNDKELELLRVELDDMTNYNSPRHPGSPNYNQIAQRMYEKTGVLRPTSTLRRIASNWRQAENFSE